MRINPYKSNAKYISFTGIMLSVAIVLTMLESIFSAFLPVGVRLGLSNVVTMTAIISINPPTAFLITILKSLFVFITRGATAGAMSLGGGFFAFLVTLLMYKYTNSSYILMSVLSAVAHSMAQICVAAVITQSFYTLYYLPLLLITSVISGVCTGIILNSVLKILQNTSLLKYDKFIERDGQINEKTQGNSSQA